MNRNPYVSTDQVETDRIQSLIFDRQCQRRLAAKAADEMTGRSKERTDLRKATRNASSAIGALKAQRPVEHFDEEIACASLFEDMLNYIERTEHHRDVFLSRLAQDFVYRIEWAQGAVEDRFSGHLMHEMVRNCIGRFREDNKISLDGMKRAVAYTIKAYNRDLLSNRYRGSSSSQSSNFVDGEKRAALCGFLQYKGNEVAQYIENFIQQQQDTPTRFGAI